MTPQLTVILQTIVETSFGSVVGGGIGSLLALTGSSKRGILSLFCKVADAAKEQDDVKIVHSVRCFDPQLDYMPFADP